MPIKEIHELMGYSAEVEEMEVPADPRNPEGDKQTVKVLWLVPNRFGPGDNKIYKFGMLEETAIQLGTILTGEAKGKIDIVSEMPPSLRHPPRRDGK